MPITTYRIDKNEHHNLQHAAGVPRETTQPAPERVEYRVVGISSNTNAFGLYGLILINLQGEVYEVAYNQVNKLNIGDSVYKTGSTWNYSFEIPTKKVVGDKKLSKDIAKRIFEEPVKVVKASLKVKK